MFLKHLHHARLIRNRTLECFERAALPNVSDDEKFRLLSFVIVGGGPTSCEFCAELYDFLHEDVTKVYPGLKQYVSVSLVERGAHLLRPFDKSLRDYVKKLFVARKIKVITNVGVQKVESHDTQRSTVAILSDGQRIPFGMLVWSAGVMPVKFADALDMPKAKSGGRLLVNDFLQVPGYEGKIYAIGDCCETIEHPLPQLAQVAAQQAKYLTKTLNKGNQKPFSFVSMGSMAAVGQHKGIYDGSKTFLQVPPVSGFMGFLLWRGAYLGMQVSVKNKILILMHWFKTRIFGREISRF